MSSDTEELRYIDQLRTELHATLDAFTAKELPTVAKQARYDNRERKAKRMYTHSGDLLSIALASHPCAEPGGSTVHSLPHVPSASQ